jgi:hypothetical protein
MRPYSHEVFPIKRLTQAVAMALATLAVSGPAFAQQSAPATQAAAAKADEAPQAMLQVQVVGARESQRSAIARKKTADTAQDSIIAEDVGAFPDRNVADAISRIAGVAVDRGEFGEGISV